MKILSEEEAQEGQTDWVITAGIKALYASGYVIAKLEDYEQGAYDTMLRVADDLAHELAMQGSTHKSLDAYRLMIRTLPSEIAFDPERIARIQAESDRVLRPWKKAAQ